MSNKRNFIIIILIVCGIGLIVYGLLNKKEEMQKNYENNVKEIRKEVEEKMTNEMKKEKINVSLTTDEEEIGKKK